MLSNQQPVKEQSIYIRVTDHLEVEKILMAYPAYNRAQLDHYISLYGPLKANVIFNLERKMNFTR